VPARTHGEPGSRCPAARCSPATTRRCPPAAASRRTPLAVSAGTLPPGLTLTGGGGLSGTPSTSGAFNFSVTATDANGCTGTQAYGIAVGLATSTTTVTFEAGPYTYRGTPFTATATVTGPGGLSQSVPVSYSGNCANVTFASGCTASAAFAGSATHQASKGRAGITIVAATANVAAIQRERARHGGQCAACRVRDLDGRGQRRHGDLRGAPRARRRLGRPHSRARSRARRQRLVQHPAGHAGRRGTPSAPPTTRGRTSWRAWPRQGSLTLTGERARRSPSARDAARGILFSLYDQTITAAGTTGPYTFRDDRRRAASRPGAVCRWRFERHANDDGHVHVHRHGHGHGEHG